MSSPPAIAMRPDAVDLSSRRLRTRAKLRALGWLLAVAPARPYAVVSGSPDIEGNSVELVRALASRMPVRWLVADPPEELRWLLDGAPGADRVRMVPKGSRAAFLSYLGARYVFFTHGLYGSPQPPRRKVFVNLWHGDGPKRRRGFAHIRSTVVVGGTELWGRRRGDTFGVGRDHALVTGNPRIDQLHRPCDEATLAALGVSPGQRLVLWLPTYRRTHYRGRRVGHVRNWSDGDELSASEQVSELLREVVGCARERGVTLAVKPHPLDGDRFGGTGMALLTDADLLEHRTTLYSLLGSTVGLITDYSSVWTDYLALDRPIGYYVPDLAEYDADRGLNVVDYSSVMAGPRLATIADFKAFIRDCLDEPDEPRAHRRRVAERIGAETRPGAAERLLVELGL